MADNIAKLQKENFELKLTHEESDLIKQYEKKIKRLDSQILADVRKEVQLKLNEMQIEENNMTEKQISKIFKIINNI